MIRMKCKESFVILGCSNLIGKACMVSESYTILVMFGGVCLHLPSQDKKKEKENATMRRLLVYVHELLMLCMLCFVDE